MTSVVTAMPGTAARIRAEPLAGSARSCTGGPSGAGPRRRPTGPAGAGARRPTGTRPCAAISRSDRSHGCEVTKRRRGMAGRPSAVRMPSMARISSARSGRPARSSRRPGPARRRRRARSARSGAQVVAVGVDVLAEQRHLAVAGRGERARLGDDLVERPAALRAAAERHDAVGARLVAAVDDRQPGGDGRAAARRSRRPTAAAGCRAGGRATPTTARPTVVVAPVAAAWRADRRLGRREAEPVDELGLLVGPQEEVDRRVAAPQAGPVRLADGAAGEHDAQRRVGAP